MSAQSQTGVSGYNVTPLLSFEDYCLFDCLVLSWVSAIYWKACLHQLGMLGEALPYQQLSMDR